MGGTSSLFSCPSLRGDEVRTEYSKGFLHTLLICVPISYTNNVSYSFELSQYARKERLGIRTSPDGPEPTTTTFLPTKESGDRYILECRMIDG